MSGNNPRAAAHWRWQEIVTYAMVGVLALFILVVVLNQFEKGMRRATLEKKIDQLSTFDLADVLAARDLDQTIKLKAIDRLAKQKTLSFYAIEKLTACALADDSTLQWHALDCLKDHPRDLSTPSIFRSLLQAKDLNVRTGAVSVLLNFDECDRDVIAAVESFPDENALSSATEKWSHMGHRAKKLAKYYFKLCESTDRWVVSFAVNGLRRVGADRDKAIAVTVKLLDHPEESARIQAAQCLGEYGFAAASALTRLRQLAKEDPACSVFAYQSIRQIEEKINAP